MIKKHNEITIKDFAVMERTGKIGHFRGKLNPLPAFMFAKKIIAEVEKLTTMLSDSASKELDEELKSSRVKYEAKLQIEVNTLQALELLIISILNNNARLFALKNKIHSRKLREITNYSDELRKLIIRIKSETGIDIKETNDIKEFQEYVKTKTDRLFLYRQKNAVENQNKKAVGIMSLVISIFMYLEISPVKSEEMLVVDFVELYKKAVQKMEAEQAQADKMKNRY